jgi:hypothetical protein
MAIWIRFAANTPVECDHLPSVWVLEFIHVAGHPKASECRLKDLDNDAGRPCEQPQDAGMAVARLRDVKR